MSAELGQFLSEASLKPIREVSVSAWVEHGPFALWLVDTLRPETVVELGSHTGYSFFAMCQAAAEAGLPTQLYAVDTWAGDEHAGFYGEEIYASVKEIAERDYPGNAHLVRKTFDDARPDFADGSVDLLHVDGRHFYEDAKHDIETYLSTLSDRGVLIVHDIAEYEGGFGVHRVWDELVTRFDTFGFRHGHGLGVVSVGDKVPAAIRELTQLPADSDGAELVRGIYSRLGAAVTLTLSDARADERWFRIGQLEAEKESMQAEFEAAQAEIAELERDKARDKATAARQLDSLTEQAAGLRRRAVAGDADRMALAAERARGDHLHTTPIGEVEKELLRRAAGKVRRTAGGVARKFRKDEPAPQVDGPAEPPVLPFPDIPEDDPLRTLFDPQWYRSQRPEAEGTEDELFDDWLRVGSARGIDPHPLFDAEWYLDQNPELRRANLVGYDVARHFGHHGYREGRSPHPLFDISYYTENHPEVLALGLNPLLHYLEYGDAGGFRPNPFLDPNWYRARAAISGNAAIHLLLEAERTLSPSKEFDAEWYLETYADAGTSEEHPLLVHLRAGHTERAAAPEDPRARSVHRILEDLWPQCRPLRTIRGSGPGRVTLVTDSLGSDSLFGGVATSLILAALWANESGRPLRVLTRNGGPKPEACRAILEMAGIPLSGNPEFVRHPPMGRDLVDVVPEDLWLTTSWWTTASVRQSVDPNRVVYLLQEDERSFYPSGDQALRAWHEMTRHEGLTIVNSHRLFRFLVESGADNLEGSGMSFDGSFSTFADIQRIPHEGRRILAFYSRPNHPRNLWALGLDVLRKTFDEGVLDPKGWELHYMGAGTPLLNLSGVPSVVHTTLPWSEYADLLGRIDVGLSLMSTPHTSYPPLDMLAAGGLVVTNSWPGKTELEQYGNRLVVAEPTTDDLVEGLRLAAERSLQNEQPGPVPEVLSRTWPEQLSQVVARLIEVHGRV